MKKLLAKSFLVGMLVAFFGLIFSFIFAVVLGTILPADPMVMGLCTYLCIVVVACARMILSRL